MKNNEIIYLLKSYEKYWFQEHAESIIILVTRDHDKSVT